MSVRQYGPGGDDGALSGCVLVLFVALLLGVALFALIADNQALRSRVRELEGQVEALGGKP